MAERSSHPHRRGRPVVAPYSLPLSRTSVWNGSSIRVGTYSGRICLGNAHHSPYLRRREAGAVGQPVDPGAGRGHIGVGAVIHIQQETLGTLQDDLLTFGRAPAKQAACITGHLLHHIAVAQAVFQVLIGSRERPIVMEVAAIFTITSAPSSTAGSSLASAALIVL